MNTQKKERRINNKAYKFLISIAFITLLCADFFVTQSFTMQAKASEPDTNTETKTTEEPNEEKDKIPKAGIIYQVYQNKAWTAEKKNGKTAGVSKEKLQVTAIKIKKNSELTGDVKYRVLQGGNWTGWLKNGAKAGEAGKQKIEGIKISLTGKLKKHYDVYYRVRTKTYGWTGWAKNGEIAGSKNYGRQITGLQVKLLQKGANDEDILADTKIPYLNASKIVLKINKQMNCVTVYHDDKPIKAFICSNGEGTPLGTYYTGVQYRWRALFYGVFGQYSTQITGNILFHSVPYDKMDNMTLQTKEYNKLGTTASHGCVRLTVEDAKWIYDNCPKKTKVIIYNSKNAGPLGKPEAEKLPKKQKWDPTDLEVKK